MSSAFERPRLVVAPITIPRRDVVKGSVLFTANCGHRSWIAAAGRKFVDEHSAVTICLTCMANTPEAVEALRAGHAIAAPGVLADIAAAGGDPHEVAEMMRRMGIQGG